MVTIQRNQFSSVLNTSSKHAKVTFKKLRSHEEQHNKGHAQKGFTLIELMIATSLLMMVMFSGYYAYSLYSQKWQKRVQVFWHNTEQATALDSLHKAISSAVPYIVNGKDDKAVIYFKGTNTQVSFISSSAIFSAEPALIQLSIEAMAESNHYNLIYQEQSIKHGLVLDIEHQALWQHKIILLSNITEFNLSYFGWQSFDELIKELNSEAFVKEDTRIWYQNHESNVNRLLPEKIQISFNSEKGISDFQIGLSQHSVHSVLMYIREDT
jgi:prepilin-type N-terminal cleavage/methylation domain-containing protein